VQRKYYTRQTVRGPQSDEVMGGSAILTLHEAEKYGMTTEEIPDTKIFKITYKDQAQYFRAQNPAQTTGIAFQASTDKNMGRSLLKRAGISISEGFTIKKSDPVEYWLEVFAALQKPLVVKPTNGTQGQSVFMNVAEEGAFRTAVRVCLQHTLHISAGAVVEEMFQGQEYRILASAAKIIGVINRRPANVVGDGTSTITQLIEQKNSDPRRGDDPNDVLVKIKVDNHVTSHIESQGLTLESIPEKDLRVFLRLNSNISTGGDSLDVTDQVHPTVIEVAQRAMAAFPGLAFAGIDFMTKDITAPQTPDSYVIVEVNDSPGYSIHDQPYEGKNRHGAYEFLCVIFPQLRNDFPQPLE